MCFMWLNYFHLNIFEVSFLSLKMTKLKPSLTNKTSYTAQGCSVKMCYSVVSALNKTDFSTGSEI